MADVFPSDVLYALFDGRYLRAGAVVATEVVAGIKAGEYANLDAAVAAIGGTEITLYVDGPTSVSGATLSIPATTSLEIKKGGMVTVGTGKALTVGGNFSAGLYQCFDGDGTVVFSATTEVLPEWLGTVNRDHITDDTAIAQTAIDAATTPAMVDLSAMALSDITPKANVQTYQKDAVNLDVNSPHCFYSQTSGLDAIKTMLQNVLHQHVNIRLIGDSITWGEMTSGMSAINPRTGELTDPRNNIDVSPSWANLFRKYIGNTYAEGATVVEDAPGSGYYERTVQTGFDNINFNFVRENGDTFAPTIIDNAGHIFDRSWNIGIHTTNPDRLEFNFTGDSFVLIYSQLTASLSYDLYIDDVSAGTFSTSGSVTFSVEREHTFAHGTHSISIRPVSPDGVNFLRLEGIKVDRTFKVSNDGIIGRETSEWLSTGTLLPNAVTAEDSAVICMLGTNDRVSVEAPTATSRLIDNLHHIHDYVTQTRGIPIVFMSANSVTMDESNTATYKFKQIDAHGAIITAARNLNADVIDHFSPFKKQLSIGCSVLYDDLHPNDLGHLLIYKNLVAALENAPQSINQAVTDSSVYSVKIYQEAIDFTAVANLTSSVPKTLGIPAGINAILSICMRCKLVTDVTWGDWAYFQAFDTANSGCRKLVGGNYVYAWVDRLQFQTVGATNLLTGFKNATGSAQDMSVEFKVCYI